MQKRTRKMVMGRRPKRRSVEKNDRRVYQAAAYPSRLSWCQRPTDLARVAKKLLAGSPPNVWLLRGPLGSGKTTFARQVLRRLGYRGVVASPTFTLKNSYRLRRQPWRRLVHVDAYRLRAAAEETSLDLPADAQDSSCLLLIEWPERLHRRPWRHALTISFAHARRGGRTLRWTERAA